jgi:invasion protein IalB
MPFAARPARTFARLLPPILLVLASAAALSAEAAKTPKPEAATASPSPAPTPPVSSEPGATTATFGDWVLRCQGAAAARVCEVALTVQIQGQQAPIAQFAIGRAPDKTLRATVVLPTNIQLPSIVRIAGDAKDKTLELNWTRCLPGGCFASAPFPDDVMQSWRTGGEPRKLTFVSAAGQGVVLPISLRGLPQAIDALPKE